MTENLPPVTPPESLSLEDFLELVVFDRAVESEGFEYAVENYPPAFADPLLHEVADSLDGLSALTERHAGAIGSFWAREDAVDQYNDALDASRARKAAATKKGKKA